MVFGSSGALDPTPILDKPGGHLAAQGMTGSFAVKRRARQSPLTRSTKSVRIEWSLGTNSTPTPMLDRPGGHLAAPTPTMQNAHEGTFIAAEDPSQLRLG